MVKYHLLYRPTLSRWPSVPRHVKATIVFCALIISWILLYHWAVIRKIKLDRSNIIHTNLIKTAFHVSVLPTNSQVLIVGIRSIILSNVYDLQAETTDMLNLELRHLSETNNAPDTWKATSIHHTHIFSAYLDSRPEVVVDQRHHDAPNETTWAMVRIIAILPIELHHAPLTCLYKYRHSKSDTFPFIRQRPATSVERIAVKENFGMRYSAFFILCDLTLPSVNTITFDDFFRGDHLPIKIGIAPTGKFKSSQIDDESLVPIHYPKNGISGTYNPDEFMAICVPVMHHNFSRTLNLIEFMEFYKMMGAEKFTFYNSSISHEVSQVLDYYVKQGIAEVLTWKLPSYYIFERTLRVDGIFAALNDCLYRSSFSNSYKYISAIDVDEFIVPRKHDNYREMLADLEAKASQGSTNAAVFNFRNVFFYLIYDDDPITLSPDIPPLYLQTKTRRVTFFNIHEDRGKYIARGQDVVELGNHKVWTYKSIPSKYDKPYVAIPVEEYVAASQHYRYCETNIEACWLRETVTDTTAHKFTKELGEKVVKACEEIFKDGCKGLLHRR